MEVCLSKKNNHFICLLALFFFALSSCGGRFDLDTERGRQSIIDEANNYLSHGNCQAALNVIDPLYKSNYNNDEITIITASAYACKGGYSLIKLAANLGDQSNPFKAIAKTMPATGESDGKITAMFDAVDVLTGSGARLNATQRTTKMNTYMVFLQMGVVGSILQAYGSPDSSGTQGVDLAYSNPRAAGEMQNHFACAIAAGLSMITDSFDYSSLSGDSTSTSAKNTLDTTCVAAGLSSCSDLSKDRTSCTGAVGETNSVRAAALITQVNSQW